MITPKCSQQAGCVLCDGCVLADPCLRALALAARCALPQPRLGAASPTILVLLSKAASQPVGGRAAWLHCAAVDCSGTGRPITVPCRGTGRLPAPVVAPAKPRTVQGASPTPGRGWSGRCRRGAVIGHFTQCNRPN